MSSSQRRFTGVVFGDADRREERFSILAASRADVEALLKETYGESCTFDLVDEHAANRIR